MDIAASHQQWRDEELEQQPDRAAGVRPELDSGNRRGRAAKCINSSLHSPALSHLLLLFAPSLLFLSFFNLDQAAHITHSEAGFMSKRVLKPVIVTHVLA